MSNVQRAVKLFSIRKCLTAPLYASNPDTSVISSFVFLLHIWNEENHK